MCGIAGIITKKNIDIQSFLNKVNQIQNHRGPDAVGNWVDNDRGIGICHQRLSILELSALGSQPMHSNSGKYSISFNGEIYNHLFIRKELENLGGETKWKGHSDTETLLNAFETFGIDKTIEKLNGMFSIALLDHWNNKLYLIRDRTGEKPLYYGLIDKGFVFASEINAFKCLDGFTPSINRSALQYYFQFNCIPQPLSIYDQVSKVKSGHYLVIDIGTLKSTEINYYSFKEIVSAPKLQINFKDASEELEQILLDTLKNQMLSDVPLGAFLSGGVDSSLLVALMQTISNEKVKTFSIGFREKAFNEAHFAKEVANYLQTDHTEMYVSPKDCLDVIPLLPKMYGEPFSDSSQIPTFLVSKIAKSRVKVSISGDGGDELFGGYNRYLYTNNYWRKILATPNLIKRGLFQFGNIIPANQIDALYQLLKPIIGRKAQINNPSEKLKKLLSVYDCKDIESFYYKITSHWLPEEQLVLECPPHKSIENSFGNLSDIEKLKALDFSNYLTNDILVKVDRASMANSLETRAPFLDPKVIQFAWQIPLEFKINSTNTKIILRDILYKHVPQNLIERPKMGFGVPLGEWLNGPLRDWAENLLDSDKIKFQGYLNNSIIQKKWQEHKSKKNNWQYHLWDILMFQAWLEDNS